MGGTRTKKRYSGVTIRTYSSGKKSIQIAFQHNGTQCRETLKGITANPQGERYAANLKAEIENAIVRGTFSYSDYFPESPRAKRLGGGKSLATIGDLLEDWLIDIERTHPHSTYRSYRKSCQAHLVPMFGDIVATELSPQHIREWIRGRSGTIKSIRNDLIPLRAILDTALNDDVIEKNPLDKIKVAKLVSRKQAKSGYAVDPLSESEVTAVLKAAAEEEPLIRNLFQFAFYSGLRTSELFGVQWSDWDQRNGVVKIQRAVVERKVKETKTKAGTREVILLPMALAALESQQEITGKQHKEIFVRPLNRGAFIDYSHMERPWKRILKAAGVRYRNQYQTRHTYASQLLSGGENPLFVATQMGHKTTEMITKHYARWVEQGEEARHVFVSEFGQ